MMLPRDLGCALVVVCLMSVSVRAQVNAGWKASASGGARYGTQDGSKGPFAGAGANQQAPNAAPTSAKPAGPADVTPVEGAMTPLNPGITRARVSKGAGTLPQDKGQVWR